MRFVLGYPTVIHVALVVEFCGGVGPVANGLIWKRYQLHYERS